MVKPMHSNPIVVDQFLFVADELFPLFMVLVFLMPIYRFTSWIVSEKLNKTKDVSKSMGVSETSYWLSWFFFYLTGMTPVSIICALLMTYGVLQNANFGPVLVLLWLFGLSLFGYILLISSLFTKPSYASVVSTLFYFVTSFLDYLVANPHTPIYTKVLASFLPQIAIKRAVVTIMQFETQRRQLTMGNLGETIHNYNLSIAYTMMLFSAVIFSLVGIYLT